MLRASWLGLYLRRPSVCHTLELYQNGVSEDHEIFTVNCLKDSSFLKSFFVTEFIASG